MKLVNFEHNGRRRPGLYHAGQVIDIGLHWPNCPSTLNDLIETWQESASHLQAILRAAPAGYALADVQLHAPIARPGKIFCTGLNYADHAAESQLALPDEPLWFVKAATAVNSPYGTVELPLVSDALDYEAELAFVIGKRCKHVSAQKAPQVIFGYCVANDFSVRDWQLRTSQYSLGKSFDTHLPYGPWIVTADEVPDPHALQIRCTVNGQERQRSSTHHLIFNCFDLVAHLSQAMTLEPGDLILTGTPSGVGYGFKPPRLLRQGDVVRVEIDGLGHIENTITQEQKVAV